MNGLKGTGAGLPPPSIFGPPTFWRSPNEPIPHPIYGGISVPALGGLANRPGHPVFILPIKLLVGEIGEKDDSVVDKDSPTALLVNPRTCVERSGCYIMIRAARAM